jgi:hypothetical protein
MKIDPKLNEQLAGTPDRTVDVILCGRFDADLLSRIERAGVAIKDRSHADDGLLYACLDQGTLAAIQDLDGVDSVSGDDTQYAL